MKKKKKVNVKKGDKAKIELFYKFLKVVVP